MYLSTITPPPVPAVSLEDARAHLRADADVGDDVVVLGCIAAAAGAVEGDTGRILMAQTREQRIDAFPMGAICLFDHPVSAIISIKYLDASGVEQTVAPTDYTAILTASAAMISPKVNTAWPVAAASPAAVAIRYSAGVTDSALIPAPLRQAMLLLIGHYYENREAAGTSMSEPPLAYRHLISPFRKLVL